MKLSDLKAAYATMNAGVWVGNLPFPLFEGVRLKVRRLWNPDYTALYAKLTAEQPDLPEGDVTTECLLGACLVDWSGVDDPFAEATARDLLADADFGAYLRGAIIWAAIHVADQIPHSSPAASLEG